MNNSRVLSPGIILEDVAATQYDAARARIVDTRVCKVAGQIQAAEAEYNINQKFPQNGILPVYKQRTIHRLHGIPVHTFSIQVKPGSQTLAEWMAEGRQISAQFRTDILDQIHDAIDALHKRKLVHLAIVPENVLLSEGPSGISALLINYRFGCFSRYCKPFEGEMQSESREELQATDLAFLERLGLLLEISDLVPQDQSDAAHALDAGMMLAEGPPKMVVERIRALQRHAITVIPNETALLLADLTGASTDIVLETRRNTPRQILPDSFSQALSNDKDGLVRIQAALLKVSVAIVAANAAYQSRLHAYLPEVPETTEVMRKLWMASSGRPGQQMILGGIENVLNNVTFDGFLWVVLALMLLSTLLRRM